MKNYQEVDFFDLKNRLLFSEDPYQSFCDYMEIDFHTLDLKSFFDSGEQKENPSFIMKAICLAWSKEVEFLNSKINKLESRIRGDCDYP
jgi:hypothetical protein